MIDKKDLRYNNELREKKEKKRKEKSIRAAALFLALAILFFGGTFILENALNQEKNWTETEAEVIDRNDEWYYDIGLEIWTWRYNFTVRYVNANGKSVDAIINAQTAYANVGEKVQIRYDPDGDGVCFGESVKDDDVLYVIIARYALLSIAIILAVLLIVLIRRKRNREFTANIE